jgi:hypothetical protein
MGLCVAPLMMMVNLLLGITINQRKYCLDLLQEIGMLAAQSKDAPMEVGQHLVHDSSNILPDITNYSRLIGRLIYLTNTRPDISYAVGRLSQFLAAPIASHQAAAYRVLKYLKNNPGEGLFFPANSTVKLLGYSDSDWGTCKDTRRSISAHCFYLGTSLI